MNAGVAWWHAQCNRATAASEARRVRQFGLHTARELPIGAEALLPGEVWAWQTTQSPDGERVPRIASPVRVGFAGHRPHTGHVGLARTATELAGEEGTVLVFDASDDSEKRILDTFLAAVSHYAPHPPQVRTVTKETELRRVQHQAARALPLSQMRRVYGWDGQTRLATMLDVADMLGFFLFAPPDLENPGVALVDALQAPHSVVLARGAQALGAEAPVLLYRRLFPHLRRAGERGSVRDPGSVIFLDDDQQTIRAKFTGAITGGRPTAEEQRALGGDPTRCSAFAAIELLCPPAQAEKALYTCRFGQATCSGCKAAHVDAVVSGIEAITARLGTARAGAAPGVGPAIDQAVQHLHRPPPRDCTDLESAIAARTGTQPDQVVVGNGSTEVMDWLFRSQIRPGGQVVATKPTFELYRELAERHGLNYIGVPWEASSLNHDLSELARTVNERTVLVVIDLPHSVSGAPKTLAAVLDHLADRLPEEACLLIDLAYADFMNPIPTVPAELLDRHPDLVVCGSLSKVHCLLGARVGYGLAAAPVAERLRQQRLPYAVDSLALAAAHAALADGEQVRRAVDANREARERLTAVLDERHISYIPSYANFLLIDLGAVYGSVADRLRKHGARFRDGRRWHLPGWIQVHMIDPPTIEPVIEAITSAVPDHHAIPTSRPATDTFTKDDTNP